MKHRGHWGLQGKAQLLRFCQLAGIYSIVRLSPDEAVPGWAARGEFTSVTRTKDELSIVCLAENIPQGVDPGPRWICFKLQGPFPFSLTGVLLSFIEPLSRNGVPIFAISTYDTDYVLVQEQFAEAARKTLGEAGHEFIR
ncbi:MAG TPA: ACT domain-containing protein [Candidatus Binatia bacterium]|nr:ACT domain-containing protein [Candidatus Binatia bacterium]